MRLFDSCRVLALAAALGAGAAGCGGDGGGGAMIRKTTLQPEGWSPRTVPAEPGDHVIFTNNKLRAQVISTSPRGLFMSDILDMGASYQWTVPKDTTLTRIDFEDDLEHAGGNITITLMPPK